MSLVFVEHDLESCREMQKESEPKWLMVKLMVKVVFVNS